MRVDLKGILILSEKPKRWTWDLWKACFNEWGNYTKKDQETDWMKKAFLANEPYIDWLEAENEDYFERIIELEDELNRFRGMSRAYNKLVEKDIKGDKTITTLKKALKFYASETNWHTNTFGDSKILKDLEENIKPFDKHNENGHLCGGKTARTVLGLFNA